MTRAPLPRKTPGLEEKEDCDCCDATCDCADCERCKDEPVLVARDWIPPPAQASTGKKAGKKRAR